MIKTTYNNGYKIKFYPIAKQEIINYFMNLQLNKGLNALNKIKWN